MACHLPPSTRDLMVRLFRADVYQRNGFVEFPPQAEFRLATEGYQLTEQVVEAPDEPPRPFDPTNLNPDFYRVRPKPVQVLVPCEPSHPEAVQIGETDNWARYEWRLAEPRVHITNTPHGPVIDEGVVAHKSTLMASFKMGKSREIGMWAAGFACLPGATIDMVGLEYGTSEHEFNYLTEALLSGKNPIVRKYNHFYNDVRGGRMYLELPNGCSFGVRSYKNKDSLRGGQITCYIFNEIYQLPGLEVFTGHAQNLRVEKGFAVFTSTPDKPWVKKLHEMAHGRNADWHCCCDNNASVNPFSFDLSGFMADAPDWQTIEQHAPGLFRLCAASGLEPGALMSREKFLISWLGKVGGFVGRVYSFTKESISCYPDTHPHIWKKAVVQNWTERQHYLKGLRADS